jgi:hypothetical protein
MTEFKKFDLSKFKTVEEANIYIRNYILKRRQSIKRKKKLDTELELAVTNLPAINAALESLEIEIKSYEVELLSQPSPTRTSELQAILKTANVEKAELIKDQEELSPNKLQRRKLWSRLTELEIEYYSYLIKQMEERKREIESNIGQ